MAARRFTRWLVETQPAAVVVTHFFPADVTAHLRAHGQLTGRLVVVITDLFPHRLWLQPAADATVVGSPLSEQLCVARGLDQHRLHVLGIPVGERFARPQTRLQAIERLGLDPKRRTVLIVSGGMGLGPMPEIVRGLAGLSGEWPARLQLLVVCGSNEALRRQLAPVAERASMPIHVFGFVETMPELMAASDVVVTKAGGLTVMEALTVGVPMVLCGTLPGQEQLNAEHVEQHGAGIQAARPADAVRAVTEILDDPARRERMHAAAQALGRPRAAEAIAELVLGREPMTNDEPTRTR